MLTELEKKVLSSIQGNIPVVKYPYRDIAEKLKITEGQALEILKDLCKKNVLLQGGFTLLQKEPKQ